MTANSREDRGLEPADNSLVPSFMKDNGTESGSNTDAGSNPNDRQNEYGNYRISIVAFAQEYGHHQRDTRDRQEDEKRYTTFYEVVATETENTPTMSIIEAT